MIVQEKNAKAPLSSARLYIASTPDVYKAKKEGWRNGKSVKMLGARTDNTLLGQTIPRSS